MPLYEEDNTPIFSRPSDQRTDEYGRRFGKRIHLLLEVVDATLEYVDDNKFLRMRMSATDWVKNEVDISAGVVGLITDA